MSDGFRWPRLRIRARLVLLVVGAISPFLVYTVIRARERLAERRAFAAERAQSIAVEVAERLDDHLAQITTLLRATAVWCARTRAWPRPTTCCCTG